jgi:hypothetical protein
MAEGVPADADTVPDVPDISPDEALYRRCLPGWYSPKAKRPSISDFMPRSWVSEDRPGDVDGLSVTRPRLTPVEDAATCPRTGKNFHVAEITVELVTALDLSVEPRPLPHDRGHSIIPELNSLDQRDPVREMWMKERAMQLQDNARMVFMASWPSASNGPRNFSPLK